MDALMSRLRNGKERHERWGLEARQVKMLYTPTLCDSQTAGQSLESSQRRKVEAYRTAVLAIKK